MPEKSRRLPRIRALYVEWQARRAGRRGLEPSIHRATRDVTGPTGWVFSATWDELDKHGDAYVRSFDPKIPPSIFVSERDRQRHGQPMPLVERCIEDHPGSRKPTNIDNIQNTAAVGALSPPTQTS